MRLSIIIVNWNQRDMLADCLQSFVPKLQPNREEVIVVDNASTDGSVEMLAERYPEVRLIRNSKNRGFAAANNQGFAVARGHYLLLLNNDTLVHGDVLNRAYEYMERHADVAVMGCKVLNDDGTTQVSTTQYPSLTNLALLTSGLWKLPWPKFLGRYQMAHWQRDDVRDVDTISGCFMLVRESAMDQVGVLDERFFFFGEETDWCKRFRDAGWRVTFAPVGEITHFGSVSARRLNHERDLMLSRAMVRLHRKHRGLVSAMLVWFVLLVFNLSRVGFWALRSMFSRRPEVRARCSHFFGVVREFFSVWPTLREVGQ